MDGCRLYHRSQIRCAPDLELFSNPSRRLRGFTRYASFATTSHKRSKKCKTLQRLRLLLCAFGHLTITGCGNKKYQSIVVSSSGRVSSVTTSTSLHALSIACPRCCCPPFAKAKQETDRPPTNFQLPRIINTRYTINTLDFGFDRPLTRGRYRDRS